jgi:hypothetical protein
MSVSPKHFAICSWRSTARRAVAPEWKTDAGCDLPGRGRAVRGMALMPRTCGEETKAGGPLSALFRRRQDAPLRYVEVQQQPAPAPAPPALPGPAPNTMLVAAPDVGWADDRSVAAAYGCQCRERR